MASLKGAAPCVCGGDFWTLADAVKQHMPSGAEGQVVSVPALDNCSSTDISGIPTAVEAAAATEQVVLALGGDAETFKQVAQALEKNPDDKVSSASMDELLKLMGLKSIKEKALQMISKKQVHVRDA